MSFTPSEIVERVRQPEYTGRNRCMPCTAVNLVLVAFLAGGGAVAVSVLSRPVAPLVGLVLFGLFAATIYLRGYLVPGTPRLTKIYFSDRVLRWFEKEPPATTGAHAGAHTAGDASTGGDVDLPAGPEGELDVERALERAGVVTECENEDDLCLEAEFAAAWRERIGTMRDQGTPREDLATVLDVVAVTCRDCEARIFEVEA